MVNDQIPRSLETIMWTTQQYKENVTINQTVRLNILFLIPPRECETLAFMSALYIREV